MIAMIVARAKNGVIGKDNSLIWHLPEDLKFFKEKTMGHVMIMGRKTFESLPGMLPRREHWVISHQGDYKLHHKDIRLFTSVEEAVKAAEEVAEVYVIGGAQIFKAFMDKAKRIYVTEIDEYMEGDTYFPAIDERVFTKVFESEVKSCDAYPWTYRFVTYEKINQ